MVPADAQAKHECPKYCHICPLLEGGIMPMCMGQAARGDWRDDMWACTCRENNKPATDAIDRYGDVVVVSR